MNKDKQVARNQIAEIEAIVNHYLHTNEMPMGSNVTLHRAFSPTTPYSYAGYVLLERAGHYNILRNVGKTLAKVIDHSPQYTKDFFSETDKMMRGFRNHADLEHILKVAYTRFFPNKQGFENIVHAFDGAAVANSLRNYNGIIGEYNYVAQAMQDIAGKSKTSSPVVAFANAINQPKIIQVKKLIESHPARHVVSKSIIDAARITLNQPATAYVADVGYRHIDEAGMHLIMDIVIANAKSSRNPSEYIQRALSKYDSPKTLPTIRRKIHSVAHSVISTLKPAA